MLSAAERFGASSLLAEQADGEKTGRPAAIWSGDNCEMAVFGNTYSYITVSLMLLGWELSAPELAAANAAMRKLPALEHGLAKDVRMTKEDSMVRLPPLCSHPPCRKLTGKVLGREEAHWFKLLTVAKQVLVDILENPHADLVAGTTHKLLSDTPGNQKRLGIQSTPSA